MTDPISFDTTTPRHGLPMLFAGQAQREVFVNEALARVDGLLHLAVEGISAAPPTTPADGQAWLVGPSPSGVWADKAGTIAFRQSGQWLFQTPRDGMHALDRSTGQIIHFAANAWHAPSAPAAPSGGTVVDVEARAAIVNLLQSLQDAGLFPTP